MGIGFHGFADTPQHNGIMKGSPRKSRAEGVVQQIKALAREDAGALDDRAFLWDVERAMQRERATILKCPEPRSTLFAIIGQRCVRRTLVDTGPIVSTNIGPLRSAPQVSRQDAADQIVG